MRNRYIIQDEHSELYWMGPYWTDNPMSGNVAAECGTYWAACYLAYQYTSKWHCQIQLDKLQKKLPDMKLTIAVRKVW